MGWKWRWWAGAQLSCAGAALDKSGLKIRRGRAGHRDPVYGPRWRCVRASGMGPILHLLYDSETYWTRKIQRRLDGRNSSPGQMAPTPAAGAASRRWPAHRTPWRRRCRDPTRGLVMLFYFHLALPFFFRWLVRIRRPWPMGSRPLVSDALFCE